MTTPHLNDPMASASNRLALIPNGMQVIISITTTSVAVMAGSSETSLAVDLLLVGSHSHCHSSLFSNSQEGKLLSSVTFSWCWAGAKVTIFQLLSPLRSGDGLLPDHSFHFWQSFKDASKECMNDLGFFVFLLIQVLVDCGSKTTVLLL